MKSNNCYYGDWECRFGMLGVRGLMDQAVLIETWSGYVIYFPDAFH